ncbi:hypothetical protein ABK040_009728 [Willaertia magna]
MNNINPTYSIKQQEITNQLNLIDAAFTNVNNKYCLVHGGFKYLNSSNSTITTNTLKNNYSENNFKQKEIYGNLFKIKIKNNKLQMKCIDIIIKRSKHCITIQQDNNNNYNNNNNYKQCLFIYGGLDENGNSHDTGGKLNNKIVNDKIFTINTTLQNLNYCNDCNSSSDDDNENEDNISINSNNSIDYTKEFVKKKNTNSSFKKVSDFYNLLFNKKVYKNNKSDDKVYNEIFNSETFNLDFNIQNKNNLENNFTDLENYFVKKLLNVTKTIIVLNKEFNLCHLILNDKLFSLFTKLNDYEFITIIDNIINNKIEKIDFKYLILLFFILYIYEIDENNLLFKFINNYINYLNINNNYYESICNLVDYLNFKYPDLILNFNFFKNLFKKCVDYLIVYNDKNKIPNFIKNYFIFGFNFLEINNYNYHDTIIKCLQNKIKEEEFYNVTSFYKYGNKNIYKYLIENLQFENKLYLKESDFYFKQILYLEKSIEEIYSCENIYLYLDLLRLCYHFKIYFLIKNLFICTRRVLFNYFNLTLQSTVLETLNEIEEFYLKENDCGFFIFKDFVKQMNGEKENNNLIKINFCNKRLKL